MKLLEALRKHTLSLNAQFEKSKLFEHSGNKGKFREKIIEKLFRPFLPDCYGLGSGEVFSLQGESSREIDIVIYDAIYSNVLFKNESASLFPCESVFDEIEVKSNLTSNELNIAIDNIASLKKLEREKATVQDITPIINLKFDPRSFRISDLKKNNYLGVIYAYDGLKAGTIAKKLHEHQEEKEFKPDFIFNQKKKYMIFKVKGEAWGVMDSDFDHYAYIDTDEDTLTFMFLTLNAWLNDIRLKTVNYDKYLKLVISEFNGRNK